MRWIALNLFLCFWCLIAEAKLVSIQGTISNAAQYNILTSVYILDFNSQSAIQTNDQGFFQVFLTQGLHCLEFSKSGFYKIKLCFDLVNDTAVNLFLHPINKYSPDWINFNPTISRNNIPDNYAFQSGLAGILPLIITDDALKPALFMAGIQQRMIGASVMNIRGLPGYSTSFFYDDAPLFYPYHGLGTFSIFDAQNSSSISIVSAGLDNGLNHAGSAQIKIGGIPINSTESGGWGIDPVFIKGAVFIHAKKWGSFYAGLRRTYLDGLLRMVEDSEYVRPLIYDFNIAWDYTHSNGIRFKFSTLMANDELVAGNRRIIKDDTGNWVQRDRGNKLVQKSVLYQFKISGYSKKKNYNVLHIYSSSYQFLNRLYNIISNVPSNQFLKSGKREMTQGIDETAMNFSSLSSSGLCRIVNIGIRHLNTGTYLYHYENKSGLKTDSIYYKIKPQQIFLHSGLEKGYKLKKYSVLSSVSLTLIGGLYNLFYLDPRISIVKNEDSATVFGFSYDMSHQPWQILSSNDIGNGTDVYIPAGNGIKPVRLQQISVSMSKLYNGIYTMKTCVYYRNLSGYSILEPGKRVRTGDFDWKQKMFTGSGNIYGFEYTMAKVKGLTTGWVSYSYLNSLRRFELLNNNNSFPYYTNRKHILSAVIINKISKHAFLSFSFSYLSGNPISPPVARYSLPISNNFIDNWAGQGIGVKSGINTLYIPSSTHFDVGYTRTKEKSFWKEKRLNISVYNLFNKTNPYDLRLEKNGIGNELSVMAYYLFPFVPTISYYALF